MDAVRIVGLEAVKTHPNVRAVCKFHIGPAGCLSVRLCPVIVKALMKNTDVQSLLRQDAAVRSIIERLSTGDSPAPVTADGARGSYAPLLAAALWRTLNRPVLYISPHIDDADHVADDLQVFAGRFVPTFPVWEDRQDQSDATDEVGAQRLRLAMWLDRMRQAGQAEPFLLSTCIQALNQPVARIELLHEQSLVLAGGQTIEPELVVG